MFRKIGDEEVMDTNLDKMIAQHWAYVQSVLIAHGESEDVIRKCGHHYRSAFAHGYKHAKEEAGERLYTRRGEKEVYEFAEAMIETLNMAKNKIKGSWKSSHNSDIFHCLTDEHTELGDALHGSGNICEEAVDVAAYAMMIYDNNKKR